MRVYYYIAEGTNPYENLALEELLFGALEQDEVILYLWQNENTVVIGRNQNAWRECRLEAFSAQGGRLARRLSGGGAVFHDLGNQNFTFLANKESYDLEKQLEVIRQAVASFGIDAIASGRNDILAQGRKFSGNAFHHTKEKAFHHGTILIHSDMEKLGRYLAPDPEKLAAKAVSSVEARVINLQELNPAITPEHMQQALLEAFEKVYGQRPEPLPPERINQEKWQELICRYAGESWRLGRNSAFSYRMYHRFSFGALELLLAVEEGVVQGATVYSDLMDANWVQGLEEALLGKRFEGEALALAVPLWTEQVAYREQVCHWMKEELSR